jgi:hypothetical protein
MGKPGNWWEFPDQPGENPWDDTGWEPDDPYNQSPQPPQTPDVPLEKPWVDFPTEGGIDTPEPQGGGPEGGWGGGGGPTRPPFGPNYTVPNAPDFHAPKFVPPTADGIFSDPGYQFRLKTGLGAMQNAAAAKGLLRTGMTFENLGDYGAQSASQEYSNIFGRALSSFDREYQGAKDEYAPKYGTWEHQDDWGQRSALAALANQWADYFRNTVSADTAFQAGLG